MQMVYSINLVLGLVIHCPTPMISYRRIDTDEYDISFDEKRYQDRLVAFYI